MDKKMKKVSIRIKQPDLPTLAPFRMSETFTLDPVKETLQNIITSLQALSAVRRRHGI